MFSNNAQRDLESLLCLYCVVDLGPRCSYIAVIIVFCLSIATGIQKQKVQDDDEDMRKLAEWAL